MFYQITMEFGWPILNNLREAVQTKNVPKSGKISKGGDQLLKIHKNTIDFQIQSG